ncbi:hypothetical protein COOONC_02426 [Cooperia oncophora]
MEQNIKKQQLEGKNVTFSTVMLLRLRRAAAEKKFDVQVNCVSEYLASLALVGPNSRKEMLTSGSAASLAALSNRSVHGSDGEADANEVESVVSSRVAVDDSIFTFGSGSTTPPLNKLQVLHLLQL